MACFEIAGRRSKKSDLYFKSRSTSNPGGGFEKLQIEQKRAISISCQAGTERQQDLWTGFWILKIWSENFLIVNILRIYWSQLLKTLLKRMCWNCLWYRYKIVNIRRCAGTSWIFCEYLEYCEYCEYWEIGKKFGNLAPSDIPPSAGGAICKLDFQSQETSDSLETISRQLNNFISKTPLWHYWKPSEANKNGRHSTCSEILAFKTDWQSSTWFSMRYVGIIIQQGPNHNSERKLCLFTGAILQRKKF